MAAEEGPVEDVAEFGNGRTKYRGLRLDGQMHGDWSWYRTDGSLMRTGSFERGRQTGTWRTFDRRGKVVKETSFGD